MKIYVIKIAVNGVSPMVWRRLRISANTSLAALHYIIQIVQGWGDDYLHQFHIYGKDYGISYEGGISFPDNPFRVVINDFAFEAGDHSHPALKYIETRWASLISYEMTTRLLKDVLPVGHSLNALTVRNHLIQVAQRLDAEAESHSGFLSGSPRDWGNRPKPGKPLVVGIDSGYVRDRDDKKRNFEIIAGKSFSVGTPADSRRFGFVQKGDCHPERRLMAHLSARGMQANQQIFFLSDGADNLRELQFGMYRCSC